jgi:hypothetical protein
MKNKTIFINNRQKQPRIIESIGFLHKKSACNTSNGILSKQPKKKQNIDKQKRIVPSENI